MRIFQACQSEVASFAVEVPSSKGDKTYEVQGTIMNGFVRCSCPGFTFKGTCRHVKTVVETCGWRSNLSSTPQTLSQKENRICPVCGRRTVDTAYMEEAK